MIGKGLTVLGVATLGTLVLLAAIGITLGPPLWAVDALFHRKGYDVAAAGFGFLIAWWALLVIGVGGSIDLWRNWKADRG